MLYCSSDVSTQLIWLSLCNEDQMHAFECSSSFRPRFNMHNNFALSGYKQICETESHVCGKSLIKIIKQECFLNTTNTYGRQPKFKCMLLNEAP